MAPALWITLAVTGCVGVIAVAMHLLGNNPATATAPINPGEGARLASTAPTSPSASPSPSASHKPRKQKAAPSARGALTVTIGAIGMSAPVVPVGVTGKGDVDIPERVDTVGWYRFSAPFTATKGSTVLVGHVDSAAQGKGAFFRLRELSAGDRIVVRTAKGRAYTYRVVSREQFPKKRIDLGPFFSLSGSPRLTMITCGGTFDSTVRSYRDNLIITAVPA